MIEYKLRRPLTVTNYLDDFLFTAETKEICDEMVRQFLTLCNEISCPVSLDKTEWGSSKMVFLGILLNGEQHCLCIPLEKKVRALNMLKWVLAKKTVTVKSLQSLSGYLNFLNKTIVPGRAFTRRMYAPYNNLNMKPYHHIRLSQEFRDDCRMWQYFLDNFEMAAMCRTFVDCANTQYAHDLDFYTDSSGAIGYGCSFNDRWIQGYWNKSFLINKKPSIQFLELYALCVGIMAWGQDLTNAKFIIYCDNKPVKDMVNNTTSGCKNCMILIRMLTVNNLIYNRTLQVKYVESKSNSRADALSRGDIKGFFRLRPHATTTPDDTPQCLWPIEKFWMD